MEMAQGDLRRKPEMVELFRVLEESGLTKERQEVAELADYLAEAEEQMGKVLEELREMRDQLSQLQDRGLRAAATRIVARAEDKAQEVVGLFGTLKENLAGAAGRAVQAFKEKGAGALRTAVAAMKIPFVLRHLKEALHSGRVCMEREAEKMGVIRAEIHAAGSHAKNIGRLLIGKEAREPVKQDPDRGLTVRLQKALAACGRAFSGMEQRTESVEKRMLRFANQETEKPKTSVKDRIRQLKNSRAAAYQPEPLEKTAER